MSLIHKSAVTTSRVLLFALQTRRFENRKFLSRDGTDTLKKQKGIEVPRNFVHETCGPQTRKHLCSPQRELLTR